MKKSRSKPTKPMVRTHSKCTPDPNEKGSTITHLYADVIIGNRLAIKLSGPRCVEHANEIVSFLNSIDASRLCHRKGHPKPVQLTLSLEFEQPAT